MKIILILYSLIQLGCASATPQADLLLTKPFRNETYHVIEKVPFVEQKAGHCGPATLAMTMQWYGKNISVDQLLSQVYTPGMQGSLQLDMITASRRQGMMAIPIQGFEALVRELNANHPVIVFENLALSWSPRWHYALVFGYDLDNELIHMHSGPESFKRWDIRKFERSWSLGDYWGLAVLPPDQLSASAGELAHIAAAAALEQVGQSDAAQMAYQKILTKWPKNLVALVGLANIAYQKKDYLWARKILKQAKVDHPEAPFVWFNSALAEAASGNIAEARESAMEALRRVSPESRDKYLHSLGPWLR